MTRAPQSLIIDSQRATLDFGGGTGVFDLNLQVPTGSILGVIGPSGCGKTTAVRLMTGLSRPTAGALYVMGRTPTKFSPRERERIGYIPQQFVLYPNLTVTENMSFVASLYGMGWRERHRRARELLEFVDLSDARNRLGSQLSGGMQRRLMLASALMHRPALIFADEPTAGIDPVLRARFWEYFRQLRDAGQTLVVTTQYVGEAAYCDRVAVMRAGRVLALAAPEDLRKQVIGGEIMVLSVEPAGVSTMLRILKEHNDVLGVRPVSTQVGTFQVLVEQFAESMPPILRELQAAGVTVNSAEEYVMPYDDVFIALMERAEQDDAARAPQQVAA